MLDKEVELVRDPLVISVHIPKTAGTSVRVALRRFYQRGMVIHYPMIWACFWRDLRRGALASAYRLLEPELERLALRYGRSRARALLRVRCLHGHLLLRDWLSFFPDAVVVTWVREPVQRLISFYHHWRRLKHTLKRSLRDLDPSLSLREYFSVPEARADDQYHYLQGVPWERINFIGIVEYLPYLWKDFCVTLGAPPLPVYESNVNPEKPSRYYEVDVETFQFLRSLFPQDVLLYERALSQWRLPYPSEALPRELRGNGERFERSVQMVGPQFQRLAS
jgi:hypothetical protein